MDKKAAAWIVGVGGIIVIVGGMYWYGLEQKEPSPEPVTNSTERTSIPRAVPDTATTPSTNVSATQTQVADDCSDLPTSSVAIAARPTKDVENPVTHKILLGGETVGEIYAADFGWPESEASIYKQTSCYAYIEASGTGRGGYILYAGPDTLFRVDLRNRTMEQIKFDGFLTDISPDETKIVSRTIKQGGTQDQPAIQVTDIATGKQTLYPVPSEFNDAGSAKFSPDGTKIAYGAVWRDENGDPTKRSVRIIDLATGTEELAGKYDIGEDRAPQVTGWADNNTPTVTD